MANFSMNSGFENLQLKLKDYKVNETEFTTKLYEEYNKYKVMLNQYAEGSAAYQFAKDKLNKIESLLAKLKEGGAEAYENTEAQITEFFDSILDNATNNGSSNIPSETPQNENTGESAPQPELEQTPEQTPETSEDVPDNSTLAISDGNVTGDWPTDSNHGNADEIEKYLMNEMGFNKAAATAVMANMYHESRFNTTTNGDGGTSYGLSQWHKERKTNLINYCNKNGYDYTTVEGQMKFYEYELKNNYPKVYEKLKNTPNTAEGAYEAADYYCVYYEVPANKHQQGDNRGAMAKKQFNSTM